MAQHDFTIDNQTFPSTRSDINSALQALASLSSGASSPSTTFAYQLWVNTTSDPNILNIRNSANNAWIEIGEVNQASAAFILTAYAYLQAGSAATPSFSFDNDRDTGMYRAAANIIGLATNGTVRVRINDSGQSEFSSGTEALPSISIIGDVNTGIFFPSADTIAFTEGGAEAMRINSSGNVGIGTTSPSANFEVSGTATQQSITRYSADASAPVLALRKSRGTEASPTIVANLDNLGQINFQGYDGAGFVNAGQILVESNGTPGVNDMPGRMAFRLSPDGSATVVTQAGITEAGLFSFNSGYGSAAVAYGCRAWVNFNGTGTIAIRESGNVSSIADNGTGLYTINIDTDMPDANYSVVLTPMQHATGTSGLTVTNILTQTAGVITISNGDSTANSYNDSSIICAAIFR